MGHRRAGLAGRLKLPRGYEVRIESLRDLVGADDKEVDMPEREIHPLAA